MGLHAKAVTGLRTTYEHQSIPFECRPGTGMYPAAFAARAHKNHVFVGDTTLVTGSPMGRFN